MLYNGNHYGKSGVGIAKLLRKKSRAANIGSDEDEPKNFGQMFFN